MCKEGWSVRLGVEGGCLHESLGNCPKYLKRGWNGKEGKENKYFQNRGQAGSRGGYLKEGPWYPLLNYACCHAHICTKLTDPFTFLISRCINITSMLVLIVFWATSNVTIKVSWLLKSPVITTKFLSLLTFWQHW